MWLESVIIYTIFAVETIPGNSGSIQIANTSEKFHYARTNLNKV